MKPTTPKAWSMLIAGSSADVRSALADRLRQACQELGLSPPDIQAVDAQNTLQFMTCARTASVILLLADADQGLLPQQHRLVYLASLMGIRHIALAVHHAAPADGDAGMFAQMLESFQRFAQPLGFQNITTLVERSIHAPWYVGPTWEEYLQPLVRDISAGDEASDSHTEPETTDQFEATLVWVNDEAGLIGRSYHIELDAQHASASLTSIKHRVNVSTLAHEAAKHLVHNDMGVCNLAISKPVLLKTPSHGPFLLRDRVSHDVVAIGIVRHSLRRAQNLHTQLLSVTRQDREKMNGHKGRVIWFTGLSGSGKSTLANALEVALQARGQRTYLLDGDNVRQGLNKDLGFTDADRVENIRRIAEVAKLMMDAGLVVMTAFISPFRRERAMARELIGGEHFLEVYVSTPLEECERRDVKGLYKKARSGLLPNMTGLHSPYEAPECPDLTIDASKLPIDAAIHQIVRIYSSEA